MTKPKFRALWISLAVVAVSATVVPLSLPAAEDAAWTVHLRQRVKPENGDAAKVVEKDDAWEPSKTAIVIVDMWDDHHCKAAAQRVVEMAPAMNKVVKAARDKGVLIIHSPSDCMEFYKNAPQRARATAADLSKSDVKFQWNYFNPEHEGTLAERLEQGGCSCDTAEPCGPGRRVWKREIDVIEIAEEDAVSDNGQEIYNLLESRAIENVIVMGVHTNRCVLGRPFGIRQMVYVGKNVVLCRDLTDSYHRDPGRHFEGLHQIIAHIETYWCPTITGESITAQPRFRFKADQTAAE